MGWWRALARRFGSGSDHARACRALAALGWQRQLAGDSRMATARGRSVAVCRLMIASVLTALFYGREWWLLCKLVRSVVSASISLLGCRTVQVDDIGGVFLVVNGVLFSIDRDCTYLNLLFVLAPFCWKAKMGWRVNLLRVAALIVAVSGANVARLLVGMYLHVQGVSWFCAHDVPHAVLYFSAVVLVAVPVLWRDLRGRSVARVEGRQRAPTGDV